MNCLDAAEEVLRRAGRPLHYQEIVRRALAKGLWQTDGDTPGATLTAALGREIRHAEEPRFVRVDRGTYGLRDWARTPAARSGERPAVGTARRERPASANRPRTGCLDAAVSVLSEAGEALHFEDIVRRALEQGLWRTTGRTPGATLTAAIGREIARDGEAARFVRFGRGMYGLRGFPPPTAGRVARWPCGRKEAILNAVGKELQALQEFLQGSADQGDAERRLPFWIELCHRGGDHETAITLAERLPAEALRSNPRLLEILHEAHAGRLVQRMDERRHVLDFCHDLRQELRRAGMDADPLTEDDIRALLQSLAPCPLEGDEVVPQRPAEGGTTGESGHDGDPAGKRGPGGEILVWDEEEPFNLG